MGGGFCVKQRESFTESTQSDTSCVHRVSSAPLIHTGKSLILSSITTRLVCSVELELHTNLVLLCSSKMSESAESLAANQKSRRNVTIEITNITNNYCLVDPK